MSIDCDLLFYLGDRAIYDRVYDYMQPQWLTKDAADLFNALPRYYAEHDCDKIDWQNYGKWFCILHVAAHDDSRQVIVQTLCDRLAAYTPGEQLSTIATNIISRTYASKIADVALSIAENKRGSISDIESLCETYANEVKKTEGSSYRVVSESISELCERRTNLIGLKWRLRFLNAAVGPIAQGDMVALAGRPELGKSTWLASEATHMAKQLPEDCHVIWINNEEDGRKVKIRCVQAALGCTSAYIKAGPKEAESRYIEAVGSPDRIMIVDAVSIGPRDIEKLLKRHKPGLIIFDQLRKLRGFDRKDRRDIEVLERTYQYARELAKEYAPVLTVHQSRGDAEGQLYPEINQLEGSQTAVQGELDVQIMLGRDPDKPNYRGFHIVKNKLDGCTNEDLRHGKFLTILRSDIARFTEAD